MSARALVALRVAASQDRTFEAFTAEIGSWWRPNDLFRFTDVGGRLAFEPDPPTHLVEVAADGSRFEVGQVRTWDPPKRLAVGWRQASFPPELTTEVTVRFDPLDGGTLVTVEHVGWDAIPADHVARHGFPLDVFQRRHAEWWQVLLGRLRTTLDGEG